MQILSSRQSAVFPSSRSIAAVLHSVLALILVFLSAAATADDSQITEIVVFGDSYSDTGNTFLAVGLPPSPLYFEGRFSNGILWHEVLARGLDLPAARPSLVGGSNYSWGGAQTGEGLGAFGTPNLGLQIDTYLAGNHPRPDQLFVIAGGGNDLIQPATPADPSAIVSNIEAHIIELADAGARRFAVANIPPLASLPGVAARDKATILEIRRLTRRTNRLLRRSLNRLERRLNETNSEVTISRINWHRAFKILLRYPRLIGVENTSETALEPPECPPCIGNPVGNSDTYFWYDDLHPTGQVFQVIGLFALGDIERDLRAEDR